MMILNITKTENSAFCGESGENTDQAVANEIARILREVANKLDAGAEAGACMDSNGNKVGNWSL